MCFECATGRIGPGLQADLIAIDARGRNLLPARDPFAAALRANAGNVEAVMAAPAALN